MARIGNEKLSSKRRIEVLTHLNGKKCKILLNQIKTADKIRLGKKIDDCDLNTMSLIEEAIKLVLDIK